MAERNTWKMSFEEIYPLISLLNVDAKKNLLEMRIHLLNDFKFLMLTLDGDEEQIVDIEIPINQQMEE